MMPAQLKETTMKPGNRTLVRVEIADDERKQTESLVERLMGKKPELRFQYIQENAQFATGAWTFRVAFIRHGLACPGHPLTQAMGLCRMDGRHEGGHDDWGDTGSNMGP